MRRMMTMMLTLAATGCAVQPQEQDENAAKKSDEMMIWVGDPTDTWLIKCKAKGGTEGPSYGGLRMCCFTDDSGTSCFSDPDMIVVKKKAAVY